MSAFNTGNLRGAEPVDPTIDLGIPRLGRSWPRLRTVLPRCRAASRWSLQTELSPMRSYGRNQAAWPGGLLLRGFPWANAWRSAVTGRLDLWSPCLPYCGRVPSQCRSRPTYPRNVALLMASEAGATAVLVAEGAANGAGDLHDGAGRTVIDIRVRGSETPRRCRCRSVTSIMPTSTSPRDPPAYPKASSEPTAAFPISSRGNETDSTSAPGTE